MQSEQNQLNLRESTPTLPVKTLALKILKLE